MLNLSYITPFHDTTVLTYEIELHTYGKKIGLNYCTMNILQSLMSLL